MFSTIHLKEILGQKHPERWANTEPKSPYFIKLKSVVEKEMAVEIYLTHWGRVTHICVSKHTIIVSDNGLSPGRRQAIIWTNAGILLIWQLGTNFSEISFEIHTFSFKKMQLKMSSGKWRPFCLGLNVLKVYTWWVMATVGHLRLTGWETSQRRQRNHTNNICTACRLLPHC